MDLIDAFIVLGSDRNRLLAVLFLLITAFGLFVATLYLTRENALLERLSWTLPAFQLETRCGLHEPDKPRPSSPGRPAPDEHTGPQGEAGRGSTGATRVDRSSGASRRDAARPECKPFFVRVVAGGMLLEVGPLFDRETLLGPATRHGHEKRCQEPFLKKKLPCHRLATNRFRTFVSGGCGDGGQVRCQAGTGELHSTPRSRCRPSSTEAGPASRHSRRPPAAGPEPRDPRSPCRERPGRDPLRIRHHPAGRSPSRR